MTKRILVRFGDMMLKHQNIGFFIKKVREHMTKRLSIFNVSYTLRHDRIFIDYEDKDEAAIITTLKRIPGILDFSIAYVTTPDLEAIIQLGRDILNQEISADDVRFKIETKRQNKRFPLTSQEITLHVSKFIIDKTKWKMKVDLHHPEFTLHIELRHEAAYLYLKRIQAMGGFPFGSQGKGTLLLSGGIDSPVAGYLSIKQGMDLELLHFESSPLTPLESVDKVIQLAKILACYTPSKTITLHLVPFYPIHDKILHDVFHPYIITVMRRMMFRIAETISLKRKNLCLITGESLGQVASQTIPSLKVIEEVTHIPILRPLITYDKLSVIDIAKTIGSYEISIQPYEDCCSIYVPKQPVTKPVSRLALTYEAKVNQEEFLNEAIAHMQTLTIGEDFPYRLSSFGIQIKDALHALSMELKTTDDHIQTK
ncbi:MAG: tRNA 4-thiouridine(8) synthase ThiI [Acholeplasma sp.]|jgi:thiamine biosynthesis protein ThiI|nr:MAG: tRNA 4-thiouridine(8) synthase ThiI [Acholeplasma sp.]